MQRSSTKNDLLRNSRAAARSAGLRYVSSDEPGLRRVGRPGRFQYVDASGRSVRDEKTLARIRALVLPPAWQDVWISRTENAHIQAYGFDAAGRKQYRYHPRWRALRDSAKYGELLDFARALPHLRRRLSRDLVRTALTKEKVVALVLRIMQATQIRVGNEKYAAANGSYGLTTLRSRHARVNGDTLDLRFRGKSGKLWHASVRDRRVTSVVRRCQAMPGDALFKYRGSDGAPHPVSSNDVNAYIKETTGHPFTAKEFRTWSATLLASIALAECEPCASPAMAKRLLAQRVQEVAARLGNTVSVCRKSYIDPAVFQCFLEGELQHALRRHLERARQSAHPGLSVEESAVCTFLEWLRAKTPSS